MVTDPKSFPSGLDQIITWPLGTVTNDPDLEAEGVIDEVKGKLKQAYGDMKDTIKSADKKAGSDVNGRQA